MAQDFEKAYSSQISTSATTLVTSNSDDALIGIRLTNITSSAVKVSVWIDVAAGGTTASIVYLAKDISIPPKASVELIQGGAKVVIQNTDLLRAVSTGASSVAAWVSYVDAIST
tara:strand:- start:208 stop:549 length:342 start_codon:yes stop_codon:yes gene_type:complete